MDAAKVEKIVLWGSGVRAVEIVCYKDHFIQDCQIMGYSIMTANCGERNWDRIPFSRRRN